MSDDKPGTPEDELDLLEVYVSVYQISQILIETVWFIKNI